MNHNDLKPILDCIPIGVFLGLTAFDVAVKLGIIEIDPSFIVILAGAFR